MGTQNVIDFCKSSHIPQLYFCSTAYTVGEGRNVYEKSKILCDKLVLESGIPKVVIFKPSIVMGTKEHPYSGHFSQFVSILIRTHKRAELIRRKLEGTLRLPVIEPVFRALGNPDAYLNLVTVDKVVEGMSIARESGIYWLTNPNPPTLSQITEWISDFIMVRFKIQSETFHRTPIEAAINRLTSAFSYYLYGDSFPSHIIEHPLITREFVHMTIINSLNIDKATHMNYTKKVGGGEHEHYPGLT